jgi:hypothetical protein
MNKHLYACFIDFKKAFDTVWRNGLFYKMLKLGIGGPFGNIIRNMYSTSFVQIKLHEGLTEPISDNTGVKQGCVMSPALFKLFINDIPDMFDPSCDPVQLHKDKFNSLLFADDLVLLSETPQGLQNALNHLSDYCKRWLLSINTEKTKVMIFNKKGCSIKGDFSMNNVSLEIVHQYTYLGMCLSTSGNFNNTIKTLCDKGTKAMFKLRNSVYQLDLNPQISLSLYDALIRPICTYGCEVWGAFTKNTDRMFSVLSEKYTLFDEPCYEKLELRFIKSILGVHHKASNAAV